MTTIHICGLDGPPPTWAFVVDQKHGVEQWNLFADSGECRTQPVVEALRRSLRWFHTDSLWQLGDKLEIVADEPVDPPQDVEFMLHPLQWKIKTIKPDNNWRARKLAECKLKWLNRYKET